MKRNKLKPIECIGYGFCAFYYLIWLLFFLWLAYIAILSIPDVLFYINLWS